MVDIRAVVGQSTYAVAGEGAFIGPRANPRGELITPDWYTQLVMDGRVFNASNAVQETFEALSVNGRGTDNINPSLLLDVPSGTTIIPLEVMLEADVAEATSEDETYSINTDDKVRFVSGGVAITAINMRKDDPNASVASFYSGSTAIVANADEDNDTIYAQTVYAEATPPTTVKGTPLLLWTARTYIPPVLIGPASFLVFIQTATADQNYWWSVKWAEIPTVQVVPS